MRKAAFFNIDGTLINVPGNMHQLSETGIEAITCCVLFETVDDLLSCYERLKERFTMVKYETGLIRMDVYRKGFETWSAVKYMYERCGCIHQCRTSESIKNRGCDMDHISCSLIQDLKESSSFLFRL